MCLEAVVVAAAAAAAGVVAGVDVVVDVVECLFDRRRISGRGTLTRCDPRRENVSEFGGGEPRSFQT